MGIVNAKMVIMIKKDSVKVCFMFIIIVCN